MFDYLSWRGDLSFSAVPFGPVDALIFSALVYLRFEGIVPEDMKYPVPLHVAAHAFSSLADVNNRVRSRNDLALLKAAAESARFRDTRLGLYRSKLLEQEQSQFAAMACMLSDDTAFLVFRGTDNTLIGWKEDFNMSFCDSVPAQREAAAYTEAFAAQWTVPLRLGGHSKGGNLAVYAGARQSANTQKRILGIYNLDGPGFTDSMMGDPGYLAMVPRIHTYIPESSIIGILLEHEEAYHVIKSRQIGPLQHEPYSWEVQGGGFIHVNEMSAGSQFADKAIKNWIEDMTDQERENFVEAVFELLGAGGASQVSDLLRPKSIHAFFKALKVNTQTKRLLAGEFVEMLRAVRETLKQE